MSRPCAECEEWKPLTAFLRTGKDAAQLDDWCRECRGAGGGAWAGRRRESSAGPQGPRAGSSVRAGNPSP